MVENCHSGNLSLCRISFSSTRKGWKVFIENALSDISRTVRLYHTVRTTCIRQYFRFLTTSGSSSPPLLAYRILTYFPKENITTNEYYRTSFENHVSSMLRYNLLRIVYYDVQAYSPLIILYNLYRTVYTSCRKSNTKLWIIAECHIQTL